VADLSASFITLSWNSSLDALNNTGLVKSACDIVSLEKYLHIVFVRVDDDRLVDRGLFNTEHDWEGVCDCGCLYFVL